MRLQFSSARGGRARQEPTGRDISKKATNSTLGPHQPIKTGSNSAFQDRKSRFTEVFQTNSTYPRVGGSCDWTESRASQHHQPKPTIDTYPPTILENGTHLNGPHQAQHGLPTNHTVEPEETSPRILTLGDWFGTTGSAHEGQTSIKDSALERTAPTVSAPVSEASRGTAPHPLAEGEPVSPLSESVGGRRPSIVFGTSEDYDNNATRPLTLSSSERSYPSSRSETQSTTLQGPPRIIPTGEGSRHGEEEECRENRAPSPSTSYYRSQDGQSVAAVPMSSSNSSGRPHSLTSSVPAASMSSRAATTPSGHRSVSAGRNQPRNDTFGSASGQGKPNANVERNGVRQWLAHVSKEHPGSRIGFIIMTLIRLLCQLVLTTGLGFVLATITSGFFGSASEPELPPVVAIAVWVLSWVSAVYAVMVWWHFTNRVADLRRLPQRDPVSRSEDAQDQDDGAKQETEEKEGPSWDQYAWRYALLDAVFAVMWIALTLLMVHDVWSFKGPYTFTKVPDLGNRFAAWPVQQTRALSRAFGLVFVLCIVISLLFLTTALFYFFCMPSIVGSLNRLISKTANEVVGA